MGNSIVDDAIEFIASQGGSHSNYKDGDGDDGDAVCMETQRLERVDAPEKLVNQQNRTIKLLNTRLNFVMYMLGISDDFSLSQKSVIDLDDNEDFPNLPTTVTKDPTIKPASTSDTSIPATSNSMSIITGSSNKDAQNVFSNAVLKAVYHENQIKLGRSKCVVVSGLPVRPDQSDTASVKQVCAKEFQMDVNIALCKRLGTEAALSSSKIRLIFVTLSSIDRANNLISCAKKLRLASDKAVCSGVYVNRFMTEAESQAAYELRCKRRSTVHISAAAGPSGLSALSNHPPVESNNQSENNNVLISNGISVQTSSSSSSSASISTTNRASAQQVPVAHTSATYIDECPREKFIPIYLIVGGSLSTVLQLWVILIPLCGLKFGFDRKSDVCLCVNCFFLVLSIFSIAWTYTGSMYVTQIRGDFTVADRTQPTYCSPTLHNYASSMIFVNWALTGICCPCCMTCDREGITSEVGPSNGGPSESGPSDLPCTDIEHHYI